MSRQKKFLFSIQATSCAGYTTLCTDNHSWRGSLVRLSNSWQARLEAFGGRGHRRGQDSTSDTARSTYIAGITLAF